MSDELIKPTQLDSLLRYPNGRSARLARRGLIPHITLPDGEVRFDPAEIEAWLSRRKKTEQAEAVGDE